MTRRKKPTIAICYDFDGTLAPGNMQEHSFLPALRMRPKQFWDRVKARAKAHDMDEILSYMEVMLDRANEQEVPITKKHFRDLGRKLVFFDGVSEWFDRIKNYARERQIGLQHFVISSGLREMIESTSIHKHFERVFASGFRYDQNDVAKWPALAVNYTNKTQYLFRINKGIPNSWDNSKINEFTPEAERPIPFANMIYIGDGDTDIPAMKMLNYQGGRSIAVYPVGTIKKKAAAEKLVTHKRANLALPAIYTDGSKIDTAVKAYIDEVAARGVFRKLAPKG